jgi:hypothetical protein
MSEVWNLCPFRSLLAAGRVSPDDRPTTFVAILGFEAEAFSPRMRADILAELRAGSMVLLISNKPELRDYAKRELTLALATPANAVVA